MASFEKRREIGRERWEKYISVFSPIGRGETGKRKIGEERLRDQ
jgi:hypothetical protein